MPESRTENRPADAFRKSIATVSLNGTLSEKLEAAAAVGFDGVEIFEADLLAFDGSAAGARGAGRLPGPARLPPGWPPSVERQARYAGFGAANGPVRAATQAREHPEAAPWL